MKSLEGIPTSSFDTTLKYSKFYVLRKVDSSGCTVPPWNMLNEKITVSQAYLAKWSYYYLNTSIETENCYLKLFLNH